MARSSACAASVRRAGRVPDPRRLPSRRESGPRQRYVLAAHPEELSHVDAGSVGRRRIEAVQGIDERNELPRREASPTRRSSTLVRPDDRGPVDLPELPARQASEQVRVERVEPGRRERLLIGRDEGPRARERGIEAMFAEQRLESGAGGGNGHKRSYFVFISQYVPMAKQKRKCDLLAPPIRPTLAALRVSR